MIKPSLPVGGSRLNANIGLKWINPECKSTSASPAALMYPLRIALDAGADGAYLHLLYPYFL
jgi:hypothetical protein